MIQKPRRTFTDEQKAEAVRIVGQSGNPVSPVAQEMGLIESALRQWVKQAQIDRSCDTQGSLTSTERQEFNALRRDLKRVRRSRNCEKKPRPSLLGKAQILWTDPAREGQFSNCPDIFHESFRIAIRGN